jgi:hypothetical protein
MDPANLFGQSNTLHKKNEDLEKEMGMKKSVKEFERA